MNDQQSYYETMYILRPDIAEDEVTNHIDKYNKLLEKQMLLLNPWGIICIVEIHKY